MGSTMIDSSLFRNFCGTERARNIWCDEAMLSNWFKFWVALAKAEEEQGIVPEGTADAINAVSDISTYDLDKMRAEIEETTHPCIPLIWEIEKRAKDGLGKYVHWGATLQDMTDTAFILAMKETAEYHEELLEAIIARLLELAEEHRKSVMAGRTHQMHAVPITFGQKLANYADELSRSLIRLREDKARILKLQFAGAAANLASMYVDGYDGQAVHRRMAELLGLTAAEIPWHSARDNMEEWAALLNTMCGSIARMCADLKLMHKQEIGEIEEDFPRGRLGSSTMPHKRNPDNYETILGMAWCVNAMEGVAWNCMQVNGERDTATMMADWYYTPCINITASFCLEMFQWLVDTIHVYPEKMKENLGVNRGALNAETMMIELGHKIGRMDAHHVVYEAAMESYEQKRELTDIFIADPRVNSVFSEKEIRTIMDPMHYIGRAEQIVDAAKKQITPLLKK
jgi:3-carboxy-cis,cis-muconate cycloisomerase